MISTNPKHFTPFLATIFLALSSTLASAHPFKIMTEDLKPFGYYENNELTGVCVEIVEALLQRLEMNHTIEVYPWDRAYRETQEQSDRILFAVGRNEARENLFKWVGPLIDNTTYFYKSKGSPVTLETFEDARQVGRIAVRKNYFTHTHLKKKGFDNLQVTREVELSLRMLAARRVDLIAAGELGLRPSCEKYNLDCNQFENTGVAVFDSKLYIAFSKDVSDQEVSRWQSSLDELKKAPLFNQIIKKYAQ